MSKLTTCQTQVPGSKAVACGCCHSTLTGLRNQPPQLPGPGARFSPHRSGDHLLQEVRVTALTTMTIPTKPASRTSSTALTAAAPSKPATSPTAVSSSPAPARAARLLPAGAGGERSRRRVGLRAGWIRPSSRSWALVRRPSDPGRPGPAVCPARPGALGSAWFAHVPAQMEMRSLAPPAGMRAAARPALVPAAPARSVWERPVVAARGAPGSSPGRLGPGRARQRAPLVLRRAAGAPPPPDLGAPLARGAEPDRRELGDARGYWGRRRP